MDENKVKEMDERKPEIEILAEIKTIFGAAKVWPLLPAIQDSFISNSFPYHNQSIFDRHFKNNYF